MKRAGSNSRTPTPRWMRKEGEAPPGSEGWATPWVQLRTFSYHPSIYPAMIGASSPGAKPGDLVTVYDKEGRPFGLGLYNPSARVPLRVVHHGAEELGERYFVEALTRAVELRRTVLGLDAVTDAYRVVNSDGDGLSGLTVDRYGDVLSVEVHSFGVFQRLGNWLAVLHELLGTRRELVSVDDGVARNERIVERRRASELVRSVKVREHGVRFEVDFTKGHKTGFFCDQRENRQRVSRWVKGRRMLDLCCYTGGFAVSAATLGEPLEVTGVDLDEEAIAQARRNGNLNQQNRIRWVHADAFAYARQMQRNGERFGVVVLDPPKFVGSRDPEEDAEGRKKYEDLNGLGISLLEPGGLLVTCSCSGLVSAEDFERMVVRAAHRLGKRLQFLDRTGPGLDHPVMSNCPEGRYLKVIWARMV